jgi:2-polyprenyl-6-methoxyphenol hydroxylase-like FAD-dependent oxidoreductase
VDGCDVLIASAGPTGLTLACEPARRDVPVRIFDRTADPGQETKVLAALDPMRTRTTGFEVFPYLARIPARTRWQPQPGEIADILTPTVRSVADPQHRQQRVMSFPSWPEPRRIDCVEVNDHLPWGFTLRVLDAVIPQLLAGTWQV